MAKALKQDVIFEYLRARILQAEQDILSLNHSLDVSRQRRAQLSAEREPFVLPAKLRKDAIAQERLRVIDVELAPLSQDIADEETALQEASDQLAAAQFKLAEAEFEAERSEIRGMLQAGLERAAVAKMDQCAVALVKAFKEAKEEDERIAAHLRSFNSLHLGYACGDIERAYLLRSRHLASLLWEILPIDRHEVGPGLRREPRKAAEVDLRTFEDALSRLNDLELAKPRPARRREPAEVSI